MIRVYRNLESLSRAAAELFVTQARHASKAHRRFAVAFSGGQTPQRVYELLAQRPFRDQVPWENTHVFWGDERCVPSDDARSNERMAREALLDHVPIPASQIHPIQCVHAPNQVARQYQALLRAFFTEQPPRFDLVLLGLGENGHTASLFPGTPVLDERERWVADVYVAEQNLYRITLTAPLINQAALVVFLVAGNTKARVLSEVLEGLRDIHRLPAQLIQPTKGDLRWLVDRPAADMLKRSPVTGTEVR